MTSIWILNTTLPYKPFSVVIMYSNNCFNKLSPLDNILYPLFPGTEPTDQSDINIVLVADLVFQWNIKAPAVAFPGNQQTLKFLNCTLLIYQPSHKLIVKRHLEPF